MHLCAYTVYDWGIRLVVFVNVLHKVNQGIQLSRADFQIVVVDEELGFRSAILAGIFKGLGGVFHAQIVAPVEVVACPVQVQPILFYGCGIGIAVCIFASKHTVDSTYAFRTVVDRFIDDIPAYHTVAHVLGHAFNPSFHGTQEGGTFLFRRFVDVGHASCGAGQVFGLGLCFLVLQTEFKVINPYGAARSTAKLNTEADDVGRIRGVVGKFSFA